MHPLFSPACSAVARLALFAVGTLRLPESEFNDLFDTILEFLEAVNNERHRAHTPETK